LEAAYAQPVYTSSTSYWHGHIPFAHFIVARLRPTLTVEFGVEHGDSLFAFADALTWNKVHDGRIVGCDTWHGDMHVGAQADWIYERVKHIGRSYGNRVTLDRITTAEFAAACPEGSVDLLHIDAAHDYGSVRADYEAMLSKLNEGAVVLFHDIAAFSPEFGVWKLWNELRQKHPHFCFAHSAGLGVLAPRGIPQQLKDVFDLKNDEKIILCGLFSKLGKTIVHEYTPQHQLHQVSRIANLPTPKEILDDPLFSICLERHRW
jgi:hypothetical protein